MGWIAVVLNDSSGSGDGATKARKLEETYERMAALWDAADPREPFFQVRG